MAVLAKERMLPVLIILFLSGPAGAAQRLSVYGLSPVNYFLQGLPGVFARSGRDGAVEAAALLSSPTEENARKYLDWNKTVLERVSRAQEAVDQGLRSELQK